MRAPKCSRGRQSYIKERLRSEGDKTRSLNTNLMEIPKREKKIIFIEIQAENFQ